MKAQPSSPLITGLFWPTKWGLARPTQDQIDDVLNKCAEQFDEGGSQWPGMTYEQGVEAAIRWVIGDTDDNPMEG